MKRIDSQALGILQRSLGLTGQGSPITELLDGTVDQVLEIGACVRRGRTQAGTEGIYAIIMECNHAIADTQTASWTPYNSGTGTIAPWPSPTPPGFDIWLLYVGGIQTVGSSTVNVALRIMNEAARQGFGIDEAGAAVVADSDIVIAHFDTALATTGSFLIQEGGSPIARLNIRLPRTTAMTLQMSSTSSAATLNRLSIIVGLFPTALGQDGVV